MSHPSRRQAIKTLLSVPFVLAAPGLLAGPGCNSLSATLPLVPTPACEDDDDDDPTIAQTEGPYFKPSSPNRSTLLESGMSGTVLALSGLVVTRSCLAVPNALIDFWQADNSGSYDNVGFRLRGHQYTDASGAYQLVTVVPGLYPGRTRHIHVKVQAPNRPILTTQLYFPGEARNATDGIFHSSLLMETATVAEGVSARFNFVLDLP